MTALCCEASLKVTLVNYICIRLKPDNIGTLKITHFFNAEFLLRMIKDWLSTIKLSYNITLPTSMSF